MVLNNIEYYSTPDGELMVKKQDEPVFKLEITNRQHITELLAIVNDRWPIAFKRLILKYSKSEPNRMYYEYNMVSRFLRCNCGEYDQNRMDIDENGNFNLEEVRCPLRGECEDEGVICKPELRRKLTEREMEVLKYIAEGHQAYDISEMLYISVATVNRHRENIKARLGLRTVGQLVNYYVTNFNR